MEIIKILLIEPNESTREVITKSLQRSFDAQVRAFKTSSDGTECLKSGESFSLVIVRNFSEVISHEQVVDHIADKILNCLYDQSLKIPLIVIGPFEHVYRQYALVSERLRIEEINRLVLKALGLKKEDFKHLKLPDYVPFPVSYFFLMHSAPCDIYIKLVKKAGDAFVKKINVNDQFTKDDLIKYEEFGVSDFYVLKENYHKFLDDLMAQNLNNLNQAKSFDEKIQATADSYQISADLIKALGITPMTVTIVNQTLTVMKSQIQKTDKLGQLLRKLLSDEGSYSYRHSHLICALSYILLPKMEWGKGDQQNSLFEKICMVSYFHDLFLEDEKLQKISDLPALKKANLDLKETELIINHAHLCAGLVQSYPKLPQGVDLLIKQHHGVSNGVGFPEALTSAISPLAIFFMVIEDFAKNILGMSDDTLTLNQMMTIAILPLKEKYQLTSYRKVVTEIENLVGSKK